MTRRLLAVAALGSLVAAACDHLHVTHGVLFYAHPVLWDQAWWVVPLFFAATIAIVLGAVPVRALLSGQGEPLPDGRHLLADAIGFLAAYLYTAFGHAQPRVVLAVLVAFWAVRLIHSRAAWMAIYSLGVAAGGTLFEAALSSTGAFTYRHPDLLGVPCWLPGIYLHIALLGGPLERLVTARSATAPSE